MESRMSSSKQGLDSLIIALDFGTTFSGIAYAFSTDPEKVYSITQWPGEENRNQPKTPTVIKYNSSSAQTFRWGYELDQVEDKISSLKLLLDPEQPHPYDIMTDVDAEIAKLPKRVLDIASDYMKAIYEHAVSVIQQDSMDPTFLDQYQKVYVLTVPAVWSDKAKSLTLQAARNAGISPIEMITEPEAAALYALESMKFRGLKENDAIVICDAGGGTVDLISYEIKSLQPFKLYPLTAASGAVAGSLMLNKRFEQSVQKAVGDEVFAALKKSDAYCTAIRYFDLTIKLGFRGKQDPCRYVQFPMANLKDNKAWGLERDAMALSGPALARIFDPITTEIGQLVHEQVESATRERVRQGYTGADPIRAIFLVGGFGSSAYLKKVIEKSNSSVIVIQPRDAWEAVVKGAVMSKLPMKATVLSTKASKHYGTKANSRWEPIRDYGQPKIWDEWEECFGCATMNWFIQMDNDLPRYSKICLSFYQNFRGKEPRLEDLITTNTLYEYGTMPAPVHPTSKLRKNCVLTTDLSVVPSHYFVSRYRKSDNEPYCELKYGLQIENNQSGLMKFSLIVDGEEYSAVEAKF